MTNKQSSQCFKLLEEQKQDCLRKAGEKMSFEQYQKEKAALNEKGALPPVEKYLEKHVPK